MALTDLERNFLVTLKNQGVSKEDATQRLEEARGRAATVEKTAEEALMKSKETRVDGLQREVDVITEEQERKLAENDFEPTLGGDLDKSAALFGKGIREAGEGVKKLLTPPVLETGESDIVADLENVFGGTVDTIKGVLTAASSPLPAILPDFAEKPVEEIFGFLGQLGEEGAKKLLTAFGANPEDEITKKTIEASGLLAQVAGGRAAGKVVKPVAGRTIKTGLKGLELVSDKVSAFLKKSAQKNIESVLRPTKKATKSRTQKILPELSEKNIKAFSQEALLNKYETALKGIGEKMEQFIEKEGVKGKTKVSDISKQIEAARDAFVETMPSGKKVIVNEPAYKAATSVIEKIAEFDEVIPNTVARRIRQSFDKQIADAKGFDIAKSLVEKSEIDFKRTVSDSIRNELAKSNPDLAKINSEYSLMRNAYDILKETNKRQTGQRPLGKTIAAATGFAAGGGLLGRIGGAVALKGLVELVDSTAWKTMSASMKNTLADALATENIPLINETIGMMIESIPEVAVVEKKEEIDNNIADEDLDTLLEQLGQ